MSRLPPILLLLLTLSLCDTAPRWKNSRSRVSPGFAKKLSSKQWKAEFYRKKWIKESFWSSIIPEQANCGIPSNAESDAVEYVVGGTDSQPGQWPWLVQIFASDADTGTVLGNQCSGAVISRRWVLTAKHCVAQNLFWKSKNVSNGETPEIKIAKSHKFVLNIHLATDVIRANVDRMDYAPPGDVLFKNDLALLHLSSPLPSTTRPICLPPPESKKSHKTYYFDPKSGDSCIQGGWGSIDRLHNIRPKVLQEVKVTLTDIRTCAEKLGKENVQVYPELEFCAGDAKGSACNGDSGAPLMCWRGGRVYASGIVSVGGKVHGPTHCGAQNVPVKYTKVRPHAEWIAQRIRAETQG